MRDDSTTVVDLSLDLSLEPAADTAVEDAERDAASIAGIVLGTLRLASGRLEMAEQALSAYRAAPEAQNELSRVRLEHLEPTVAALEAMASMWPVMGPELDR